MHNGDFDRTTVRRRLIAIAVVLVVAALPAACKKSDPPAAAAPSTAAAKYFGPDRYGKITIAMSETEALATGDLQTSPTSTVLGRNVYSFVGGPKPDPRRMAADEEIEKAVREADQLGSGGSAADNAKAAHAYAQSAERIADRLKAYLDGGGATFVDGKLTSIAAPAGASTEAGIRRGSTPAELKAAYGSDLRTSSKTSYELPVSGSPGWTMLFELERGKVRYLSLGRSS